MGFLRCGADGRQPDGRAGERRPPLSAGTAAAGENDPHQQWKGAMTAMQMVFFLLSFTDYLCGHASFSAALHEESHPLAG